MTGTSQEQTAGSRTFVYLVSAVAALGGFLFGFDTAVINGAILFLRRAFSLTELQTEIAAASLLVGCIVGASSGGTFSDWFGRRKLLVLSAALFLASSVGAALPQNITQFVIARFIGGIAIGVASAISPLYIAEISPPEIRGRLVTLNQLAIVSGILAAFVVNWWLSRFGAESWRWMFLAAAVPSLVFLLSLLVVPESPRWLLQRGRKAEADAVLRKLFGPAQAKALTQEIEAVIQRETEASVGAAFSTSAPPAAADRRHARGVLAGDRHQHDPVLRFGDLQRTGAYGQRFLGPARECGYRRDQPGRDHRRDSVSGPRRTERAATVRHRRYGGSHGGAGHRLPAAPTSRRRRPRLHSVLWSSPLP
jgi:hypothetical protein